MRQCLVRVLKGCASAAAFAVIATPAAAAEPEDPPGIVVLREVGPRNALGQTNGPALTVATAPDSGVFGAMTGHLHTLSDMEAAAIRTGGTSGAGVPGVINPIFQQAFGPGGGGAAVHQSGGRGSIGSTVNGAVETGVGAMRGALSGLRGVCC